MVQFNNIYSTFLRKYMYGISSISPRPTIYCLQVSSRCPMCRNLGFSSLQVYGPAGFNREHYLSKMLPLPFFYGFKDQIFLSIFFYSSDKDRKARLFSDDIVQVMEILKFVLTYLYLKRRACNVLLN